MMYNVEKRDLSRVTAIQPTITSVVGLSRFMVRRGFKGKKKGVQDALYKKMETNRIPQLAALAKLLRKDNNLQLKRFRDKID